MKCKLPGHVNPLVINIVSILANTFPNISLGPYMQKKAQ